MQPLALSHMCIVSSVGFGQDATVSALESGRSGLLPCHFESIDLPTWTGEIEALDNIRLPAAYARFECRNNRLAEIALAQDGFAEAVSAAVERYGADRIGLFLGTSTSGIAQTEHAFRARDQLTGNLPDWFHYEQTHNTGSLAAFMRARLRICRPGVCRIVRVRVIGKGVRQRVAHDRSRAVRRGDRWRRRHAVFHDVVWVPLAEPELARPMPSLRREARWYFDRRGGGVRPARARDTA